MPPSSLQGLDIIRPVQDSSPADSRDLLLGQPYPDLSAQLDLWASLNFESDDPLATENNDHKRSLRFLPEEDDDDERSTLIDEKDGHPNVTASNQVQSQNNPGLVNPAAVAAAAAAAASAQSFDLNAFLASLGLDSFAAAAAVAAATPHQHNPQLQQPQAHPQVIAPSLAQILALHSVHNVAYPPPGYLPYPLPPVNPSSAATPFRDGPPSEESYGSAKRPRTRSSSVTLNSSEDGSPSSGTAPATPIIPSGSAYPSPPGLTPLSAAEDKRRRNTAASARFRLKKKEREAALETKSKELESKVVELERECEALRRENGWLKGLVVGVTGAAAQTPSGQGLVPPAS